MNRKEAKDQIKEHCGEGWLTLVNIVFDNVPKGIEITEVFQKYAGLEIRFDGEDEHFQELVDNVRFVSEKMCEVCGESASYSIIDGWETILCDLHFEASEAKEKYRFDLEAD